MAENTLSINRTTYQVSKATFRFIADAGEGEPGWEFNVRTEPLEYRDEDPLTAVLPRFYAEGDPIPLEDLDDLTGVELKLQEPFDEESGEPYFTLYLFEHGELRDLTLKFLERDDQRYRIRVTATIPAGTVLSEDASLEIHTWLERLPNGSYPG